MLKRRWFLIGMLVILVLLTALTIMAFQTAPKAPAEPLPSSDSYRIDWDVTASGGATMTSSQYVMYSTMGQPIAGQNTSIHYELNSGFWQKLFYFFLPFIMK